VGAPQNDVLREVCARIDDADLDALAGLLACLDAKQRAALVPALEQHTPTPAEPEPVVPPPVQEKPEPAGGPIGHVLTAVATLVYGTAGDVPRDGQDRQALLARQRLRDQEYRRQRDEWHLRVVAADAARRLNDRRWAARATAIVACVPTAADAVKCMLRSWRVGRRLTVPPEAVPLLLRVRGSQWCATVARGMVRRARPTNGGSWPFTEALLRAVGADAPEEPGAVAQYVAMWRGRPLAPLLAADPWLDRLVPRLFDDDRVAVAFASGVAARDWPDALVELAGGGRVERGVLIGGCLRRLRAGGRKGLLQPYLELLRRLEPGPDELAGHRQELTGLLSAPLSTVAEFAYTSLRSLESQGAPDPATLIEITRSMLSRPEKKLVRAHLRRLRGCAAEPLLDGLIVGLHHPVPELAGQTLDLIEPQVPTLSEAARERLRDEVPALDGDVGARLAAALGVAPAPAASAPVLLADLPADLPPPLDLGGLAGELATLLRAGDDDPVRRELVLDGLVRAVHADRAAAARVLRPLIPQWPSAWGTVIGAAAGAPVAITPPVWPPPPSRGPQPPPLVVFLERLLVELAARLVAEPPPGLLATPATVAGQVDPGRVLALLEQVERDGRQPGPVDLTQALLRLPRRVDPAVRMGAGRLVSPAGRRFAERLAAFAGLGSGGVDSAGSGSGGLDFGGLGAAEPRTWMAETASRTHRFGARVAMLDAPGFPPEIGDARSAAERARSSWQLPSLSLWPMITPAHREVAAAHLQPFVAATVESGNPGTGLFAGLAAADGPPGPAMAATLAYGFASHRQTVRLAAADALITLAARPGWTATAVGEELGTLAATERIVLQRTVQPLTEALRAGAHTAVWQLTWAALPALLAAGPRPGLADLITLTAEALRVHARSGPPDVAGLPPGRDAGAALAALAGRPGKSRLPEAARRLTGVLADSVPPP
jgi:hypothetical protein